MGLKIKPVYGCQSMHIEHLYQLPMEWCMAHCLCGDVWSEESQGPCLVGSGTCYWTCTGGYCEDLPGTWLMCHSFWHLSGHTCDVIPDGPTQHEFDIPRTVWFDYNMGGTDPVMLEHWQKEDQNIVLRFANVRNNINVKILVDTEYFLP